MVVLCYIFSELGLFTNILSSLYERNGLHQGFLLLLGPWTSPFALVRFTYRTLELARWCPSLQVLERHFKRGTLTMISQCLRDWDNNHVPFLVIFTLFFNIYCIIFVAAILCIKDLEIKKTLKTQKIRKFTTPKITMSL